MNFEIGSIPPYKKRGWQVLIDGVEQTVGKIVISSPLYGTLEYGLRPEGYDGWAYRETGGGGVVTIPYARDTEGGIHVGLLLEDRANMGGPVWCAIGGFVEFGESHDQAQAREADEETGLDTARGAKLPGQPINANRAFFVADASADEGVHAYCKDIPYAWLESDPNPLSGRALTSSARFNHKKAGNVRFFPLGEAVLLTADALALSALMRMQAMVNSLP